MPAAPKFDDVKCRPIKLLDSLTKCQKRVSSFWVLNSSDDYKGDGRHEGHDHDVLGALVLEV